MKIKKFYEDAIIPEYQTEGAAGFDLCAYIKEPEIIPAGGIKAFKTGIGVEIPEGYELQIRSRSGLAYKNYVTLLNGIGTIDSDYRGEIGIIVINLSKEPYVIKDGERICQMVIAPYQRVEWDQVEVLDDTDRGDGGFGHSGTL